MAATVPDQPSLVLFFHGTGLGGAELSALRLLEHVRARGWGTRLITCHRGELWDRFAAATDAQLLVPFPYPRKPATWLRLPRFTRAVKTFLQNDARRQVLLSGDFYTLWAALRFQRAGRPVLSLWQGEYRFDDDSCARKWLHYGAARSDRLLASEPIATHANQTRLLPQAVQALNPFVDETRFQPGAHSRAELRRKFGWPENAHVALCVGRVGTGKGQQWLAEQFLAENAFPTKARLVIAGPGDDTELNPLRVLADASNGRIEVLGPRSDIPELLAAADLAIQPGTLAESFGLAAIETALMEKPLLALRVGALPFTLGADYPGLLPVSERAQLIPRWLALVRGETTPWGTPELREKLVNRFGRAAWERQVAAALAI